MIRKDSSIECVFHEHLAGWLIEIDTQTPPEDLSKNVITSGSESAPVHANKSLHYSVPGQAADLRFRSWYTGDSAETTAQQDIITWARAVYCKRHNIPKQWLDIIRESDHFHIEFQPKRIRGGPPID